MIQVIRLTISCVVLSLSVDSAALQQLDTVQITGITEELFGATSLTGYNQRLTEEQWRDGFVQLPDLLAQQSGIDIQSIGGLGHYSVPVIRGSAGQQVLVFWDGLLMNSLNGGAADLSRLNLEQAHSIDIYRGEAPVELSASVVGGAINIHSYGPSTNSQNGSLSFLRGSYGTYKATFSQGADLHWGHWYLSADHQSADNDFEYKEDQPVATPQSPAFEKRHNNESEQTTVLLKGKIQSSFGRWDTAIQSYKGNRGLTGKINSKDNNANIETDSANLQINFRGAEHSHNPFELKSAYLWQQEDYDDRYSDIGLGAQLNRYTTSGYQLQGTQYIIRNNWSFAFIARHHHEKIKSEYKLLTTEELEDQCLAGRGCDEAYTRSQTDIGSRVELNTGIGEIKLQYSLINISDKNLEGKNSSKNDKHNSWSVGITHFLAGGSSVYGKLSRQQRIPTTQEVFGDRGNSVGNPGLLPETSLQTEAGLAIPFNRVELTSSLYHRKLEQAIYSEADSRGVIRYGNLGETLHIGLEQDISWYITDNLTFNSALTLQSNEIISDDRFSFYEGKQVANYDQWSIFMAATWRMNHWFLTISNSRSGDGYYNNSNLLEKDSLNRWDARASYQSKRWQLSLSITDATSNRARDYPDYPEPGRMLFFKTKYQW